MTFYYFKYLQYNQLFLKKKKKEKKKYKIHSGGYIDFQHLSTQCPTEEQNINHQGT